MADSRLAQFASSDPTNPDTAFWEQKVYFDGVPRRRREIVPTLAATPYMTEKAARLFLASAAVADGTPQLSPPQAWFADGSLAAFGYNPDQPREKGRFASGGGGGGKSEKSSGRSKGKEDGTAAYPFTLGEKPAKSKGNKGGVEPGGKNLRDVIADRKKAKREAANESLRRGVARDVAEAKSAKAGAKSSASKGGDLTKEKFRKAMDTAAKAVGNKSADDFAKKLGGANGEKAAGAGGLTKDKFRKALDGAAKAVGSKNANDFAKNIGDHAKKPAGAETKRGGDTKR